MTILPYIMIQAPSPPKIQSSYSKHSQRANLCGGQIVMQIATKMQSRSFYHPEPLHKISSQSVNNFLSNMLTNGDSIINITAGTAMSVFVLFHYRVMSVVILSSDISQQKFPLQHTRR